jgi:hypothetical protein
VNPEETNEKHYVEVTGPFSKTCHECVINPACVMACKCHEVITNKQGKLSPKTVDSTFDLRKNHCSELKNKDGSLVCTDGSTVTTKKSYKKIVMVLLAMLALGVMYYLFSRNKKGSSDAAPNAVPAASSSEDGTVPISAGQAL